jgi:ketosteroid isomerase-like protein
MQTQQDGALVVERFFSALEEADVEAFLSIWADDGVQEMPYAPDGFPRRLEGKEAIRQQYSALPTNFRSMRFPREILPLADPDRFLVRYRGEIELRAGGRYDNTYVGIFTLRDGRIVELVEYFDPIVLQRAFGDALAASFNVADENIADIVARIAYYADARAWTELHDLFAQSVHVDYTSLFGGTPADLSAHELMTGWRAFLPGFDATQHLLGPILVETKGARASAWTHIRATHRIGGELWVVGGRWAIALVREAAWRIASITFEFAYQEGNTDLPNLARERAARAQ